MSAFVQVPSFTSTKLLWLQRHEPEVWSQLACVLLPHDYMNYWLTGNKVTEVSRHDVLQHVIHTTRGYVSAVLHIVVSAGNTFAGLAGLRLALKLLICLFHCCTCCRLVMRAGQACCWLLVGNGYS
jgi:hypothetical protein